MTAPASRIFSFEPYKRLCYYPSSNDRDLWMLLRLDCDLFVMSEIRREAVSWRRIQANFKKQGIEATFLHQSDGHLCFRSKWQTVWIFIEDNNVTLQRMKDAGLRISHFVGICDGCREGGNPECVHERPFLSRLLPLAVNGMAYTTDHSRPLERKREWYPDAPTHARFCNLVQWRDFPDADRYRQGIGPDLHDEVRGSPEFELQGVLVSPLHNPRGCIDAKDLVILPKGRFPTQLNRLIPFRTQRGQGVLAEYRVFFRGNWDRSWQDEPEYGYADSSGV